MSKTVKNRPQPVVKKKDTEIPAKRNKWMIISMFAFVLLLYGNTLVNKYAMDDELVTSKNRRVENGIRAIPGIFMSLYSEGKLKYEYRPIVKVTYAIEYELFGENPAVSHFVNLLLYALTALLLFIILKKLFKEYSIYFPFAIVILFIAHPIHTEVVASLKNRDEMLSFFFSLLTLNYLMKYTDTSKLKYVFFAMLFYLIAYLSKASALVFLALYPLVLYFYPGANFKKIMLVFAVILVAVLMARFLPKLYLPKPDREVYFFENPLYFQHGILMKLGVGMMTLWFYLKILIFPHPLVFYYGFDMIPIVKIFNVWAIIIMILHIGLFSFAIYKIKEKHVLSFAILFYLVAISMFSNIVKPAVGIVAERFAYASSLGFCIALAYFFFRILKLEIKSSSISKSNVNKLFMLMMILLIPYSAKTISRNTSWKDHMTLYKNDIKYLDNSAKAQALIAGTQLTEVNKELFKGNTPRDLKEKIDMIFKHYKRSIEIYPEYSSSWNNIGSVYFTILQDYRSSMPYFKKAIEIDPEYTEAYFNLGYSYEKLNKYDSALYNYNKAIGVNPNYYRAISNKANVYNALGKMDSAILINKDLMKRNPSSDQPYVNIGNYYLKKGDTITAISYMEQAAVKFPDNADLCLNLSKYFKAKKDSIKSEKFLNMAIDAKNKQAQNNKR
jgi:protein O-mannosyl-transferase